MRGHVRVRVPHHGTIHTSIGHTGALLLDITHVELSSVLARSRLWYCIQQMKYSLSLLLFIGCPRALAINSTEQ